MAEINLGAIRFNWKGAYAGGTAYVVDDVVSYLGSSYVCILASTGNVPTNGTYWNLMAQGGTGASSTLTTQGDILYRNASGLARLGAGTSGQALLTGGTGANPSWGEAGGGKLLQVVTAVHSTAATQGDATFVNTGLTAAITPSATSSKIFVITTQTGFIVSSADRYAQARISRIFSGSSATILCTVQGTNSQDKSPISFSMTTLDSPNTTNAITYKTQFNINDSSADVYVQQNSTNSTMTLMEIGA